MRTFLKSGSKYRISSFILKMRLKNQHFSSWVEVWTKRLFIVSDSLEASVEHECFEIVTSFHNIKVKI